VQRTGSREVHPPCLREGRSAGIGLGLPYQRLPLYQRQSLDQTPRREAVGTHGEARNPSREAATGMDQRCRGREVRPDYAPTGGDEAEGHAGGDRAYQECAQRAEAIQEEGKRERKGSRALRLDNKH